MLRAALVLGTLVVLGPLASLPVLGGPADGTARPTSLLEPNATYPLVDPFDYSDVILLGNNNSATSRNLTAHFQAVHGMASDHVFLADLPVAETITPAEWSAFASWFTGEMANRSLGADINYIVTFKGMPIRVWWSNPNGPTSFQDALMLLGGSYESNIGNAAAIGYANPYFNRTERFTFEQFGIRLVTGIYAFNESTAMALIDRAANSLGSRGEFVLDADSSKGMVGGWGGYAYANAALVWANGSLSASGQAVYLDTNTTYVTGRTGVLGYSSWGSNDCCWGSVAPVAKPQNTWVNGSIGETFVSTGARTFTWPPSYGQSLIADWIDEGANGMKGYTDEPYIGAIADGHILYPRYVAGYNLAESYWAASHVMGWRQIVIGDPKTAPYADIGDLTVNATLTSVPPRVLQFSTLPVSVGLDNTAAVDRTFDIRLVVSNVTLANMTVHVPAHSAARYNTTVDLAGVDPSVWGNVNFTIVLDAAASVEERSESNNAGIRPIEILRLPIATAAFDVQSAPTFDDFTLQLGASRADRPIAYFEWDTDGVPQAVEPAVASASTVVLSFLISGNHSFNVTAVDSIGLRSAVVGPLFVSVLNRAPVAVATANVTETESLVPVAFYGTGSSDRDGSIVSYTWDLGVAGGAEGAAFMLAFTHAGLYTVTLTVEDNEGARNTTSLLINVSNRSPLAQLSVNATLTSSLVPLNFSAAGSLDLDGAIVSYVFTFDDGAVASGVTPWAIHAFSTPGTHGVTLAVTDDVGASTVVLAVATIENRAPLVRWKAGAVFAAQEGVAYSVTAEASDLDGGLSSYSAAFGDAGHGSGVLSVTSTSIGLTHTYLSEGSFALRLTVVDEWGTSTTLTANVDVVHPAPIAPPAVIVVDGQNLTVGYTVTSPYDTLELWVVIDGSTWRAFGIERNGSRDVKLPELSPGNHTVEIVVSDGVKSVSLGDFTYAVASPPPTSPPVTTPPPDPAFPLAGVVAAGVAGAALGLIGVLLLLRRWHASPKESPSKDEQAAER